MAFPVHPVDTFAAAVFQGNPAAVMPLHAPLAAPLMQRLLGQARTYLRGYVEWTS